MRYTSILIFLCSTLFLQAQLIEMPLPYDAILAKEAAKKQKRGGGPLDTLDLPFIDDFSTNSVYPDSKLWTDNAAYINRTMAINPPSIGVATLDGMRYNGAPYANGGQGSADTLTVCPIDLGGKTASSNIKLSFFYQPRGLGDKPGDSDSLLVEFKDNTGKWNIVYSHADTNSSQAIPVFNFEVIDVSNPKYFYKGFQFRFRNLAKLTGSRDHWHIDYVRLTEGQTPTTTLDDVAFSQPPSSIFKNYTALPMAHFANNEATELVRQPTMYIQNNFNIAQQVRPAFVELEQDGGTPFFSKEMLDFGVTPINGNIPVGLSVIDSIFSTSEYTDFTNQFSPYYNMDSVVLNFVLRMTPANQQNTIPAIVANDRVVRPLVFDNYFAHDDGTAEAAVAAGRIGDEFAVRFHANVADTLRAIQIHIPRLEGTITNQRINLKVWVGDLNNPVAWSRTFVKPVYVDSINSWTVYSLDTTPVALPANTDFFIGWQQATTPTAINRSFMIGYDKNTTRGFNFLYQNVGANWEKIDTVGQSPIAGAIMMRPIVGNKTVFSTNTVEKKRLSFGVNVYPNPVRSQLMIDLKDGNYNDYQYSLFNLIGQQVQFGDLTSNINVDQLNNGVYLLKIVRLSDNTVVNRKIMVHH